MTNNAALLKKASDKLDELLDEHMEGYSFHTSLELSVRPKTF